MKLLEYSLKVRESAGENTLHMGRNAFRVEPILFHQDVPCAVLDEPVRQSDTRHMGIVNVLRFQHFQHCRTKPALEATLLNRDHVGMVERYLRQQFHVQWLQIAGVNDGGGNAIFRKMLRRGESRVNHRADGHQSHVRARFGV